MLTAALLNQNELSHLNSSLIPDILLVLSLLLFLLSIITWAIQEKLSIHWLWHAFHAAIGLLALTLDFRLVLFFGLLPAILLYVKDFENNFRYIWNLFFMLELMTTIMLVFVTN
jgi:hypothetical protein